MKGRIAYANRTFSHVCGYGVSELMGKAHGVVRHPDMPRAAFKLLWDTISDGREILAYGKKNPLHRQASLP